MGESLKNCQIFLDNILFYLQKSGGGSVYWAELSYRLNKLPNVSFIRPTGRTVNKLYNQLNIENEIVESVLPLKILRYFPLTVRLPENSIFHSSYYRYSGEKHIKNFITVHDFVYEYYQSGLKKWVHSAQKNQAIKHSNHIVCISNSTKADLLRFYPGIEKQKNIKVIYNGVSSDYYRISDLSESSFDLDDKKFVLYVGHRSAYKNFDFAISTIVELPSEFKLAIVGSELSAYEFQLLEKKLNGRYVFFGSVDNSQLNELYNRSHCLIYPSSYEGFGIPVLEAFRAGCPVVALDIPAIAEISKNGAFLHEELNTSHFVKTIRLIESDHSLEEKVEEASSISLAFSWDKCYNELLDFYNI